MSKYFYQDFLFKDMQIDDREFPDISLKYCDDSESIPYYTMSQVDYASTSAIDVCKFELSFLMDKTKEEEWNSIRNFASCCKSVVIVDDIPIVNKEVLKYKEFYLKTYSYVFTKDCHCDCRILSVE